MGEGAYKGLHVVYISFQRIKGGGLPSGWPFFFVGKRIKYYSNIFYINNIWYICSYKTKDYGKSYTCTFDGRKA